VKTDIVIEASFIDCLNLTWREERDSGLEFNTRVTSLTGHAMVQLVEVRSYKA
jgi:hypothetical protein